MAERSEVVSKRLVERRREMSETSTNGGTSDVGILPGERKRLARDNAGLNENLARRGVVLSLAASNGGISVTDYRRSPSVGDRVLSYIFTCTL